MIPAHTTHREAPRVCCTQVEQLDEAFVDSFVVPPPPPQSAPPDPHTAAMDGLEHTVAAATASPLPTPLPAGPASTASVSPGTSCVALASAAVSPPSVQPADAPIGSIGAPRPHHHVRVAAYDVGSPLTPRHVQREAPPSVLA